MGKRFRWYIGLDNILKIGKAIIVKRFTNFGNLFKSLFYIIMFFLQISKYDKNRLILGA